MMAGAMEIALGEGGSFHAQNVTAHECVASNMEGEGGWLYLDSSAQPLSSFAFTIMSFGNNEARFGKNLFIHTHTLRYSITSISMNFTIPHGPGHETLFMGTDLSDTFTHPYDLRRFLMRVSPTVHVSSENGHDSLTCGSVSRPCGLIGLGLYHLSEEDDIRVLILDGEISVEEIFPLEPHHPIERTPLG